KDLAIKGNNIFLKIDIKSFFDNVNHNLLLKKLKKRIKDKKTLSLITDAIENPTGFNSHKNYEGLPQGIAISNILSHIYLKDLDEYYDKRNDLIYIRYVDDLLILCPTITQAESLKKEMKNKLKDEFYLDINEDKGKIGNIYDEKFNFLGYEIGSINSSKNELKIVMNKKSILKIEKKIINLLTVFKKERKYKIGRESCRKKNRVQTCDIPIYKLKDKFYLNINEDKRKIGNIYDEKFNFLGYEIGSINSSKNELKIVMNKKSILKIEKKIINLLTVFKKERKYTIEKMIFNLNLLITGSLIQNESHSKYKYDRRGWLFYYLQITDITVLYHLDQFVRDKIKNIDKIDNDIKLYGLKKFSKAYFEMKYNLSKTTYIFNINKVDKENKQRILKEFYNKEPDEENIDKIFRYTI